MNEWRVPFDDQSAQELLGALQLGEAPERHARAKTDAMEFLVEKFKDVKIEIYANEHPPPHFHVKTNIGSASFSISDCELVHGDYFLSKRMKEIRAWHAVRKQDLIRCWNETRPTDCPVGEYWE